MFLNNRQALYLTGILTLCFFLAGVLGFLDNYMVIAIIAILFLTIVVQIVMVFLNKKNPE